MAQYDEKNSTVSWMPGFLRKVFGLEADYQRPDYGAGASRSTSPATPGTPPPTTSYRPATESYRSERPAFLSEASRAPASERPAFLSEASRAPASERPAFLREAVPAGEQSGAGEGSIEPRSPAQAPLDTPIQPLTYLVRGYIRGASPPQGLAQFTRELRETLMQVGEFYGSWLQFQAQELTRAIDDFRAPTAGQAVDSVQVPAAPAPTPPTQPAAQVPVPPAPQAATPPAVPKPAPSVAQAPTQPGAQAQTPAKSADQSQKSGSKSSSPPKKEKEDDKPWSESKP